MWLSLKSQVSLVYMFHAIWEFALSADSVALSGNSLMAQHFLESYDRVTEPACHARQSNYTQYQDMVYRYTPGSLSRVIVECDEEEAL